jgi:hypothetical protein
MVEGVLGKIIVDLGNENSEKFGNNNVGSNARRAFAKI